jgi:hypothetical protein
MAWAKTAKNSAISHLEPLLPPRWFISRHWRTLLHREAKLEESSNKKAEGRAP